jgi:small conductance mechanosensitive channel
MGHDQRAARPRESLVAPNTGSGYRPCRNAARRECALLILLILLVLLTGPGASWAQSDLLLGTPERPAEEAATAAPTIEPLHDQEEDEAIALRLRTIYDTVDGLAPVQVKVASGVVVLAGEVSAQAKKEQAVRLARNVRGVAEVEDRISVAQDLEGRLTPAVQRLAEAWNSFVRLLPVLLVGALIMALAVVAGRWLARREAIYRRIAGSDFTARLLGQVVQAIALFAGAGLTLLLLDATGLVTTLLGAAGIVGLAIGFALRDTVENYIASVLLSLRRPFNPGDYVRIEEHEGVVARLTSRATILLSLDGNQIRIPNSTVFKGLIVNFTNFSRRRLTFQLGIAPDENLARAQATALDAVAAVDGVLADPPPAALFDSIGDSTVNMTVSAWMDQATHDFLRVRSEAIRMVMARMNEAGVDLPEPTVRLRRAPAVSRSAGEAPSLPRMPTTADRALGEVVEQERRRRPDLLDPSALEE